MRVHGSTRERLGIRLAHPEDVHHLSLILSQAFHHDPVYRWLFPKESGRTRKCERLFEIFLDDLVTQQTVFTTAGMEGAALWMSPWQVRCSWIKQVRRGILILPILGLDILRGIQWWLAVELKQPCCYPHWYLFLLGVAPEHQGKGIGSALLQPMLERCGIERLPIYLDTGNKENVSFYQRKGFEIIGEVDLPDGLRIFRMVREPGK